MMPHFPSKDSIMNEITSTYIGQSLPADTPHVCLLNSDWTSTIYVNQLSFMNLIMLYAVGCKRFAADMES